MICYIKKYYCLWLRFIVCQDMGVYVCLCCKFKSALYKFVGTLYKLIFPPFWSVCCACLQLKKIFEIKIHIKFIPVRIDYDDWKKPLGFIIMYYDIIIRTFNIVLLSMAHWCILCSEVCRIMPFCYRIRTYYSELCEHSFETCCKYLHCRTKTKLCSNSVSRFSKGNLIL